MIYFFLPVGIQGLEFDVFFPTSERWGLGLRVNGTSLGLRVKRHEFGVEGSSRANLVVS